MLTGLDHVQLAMPAGLEEMARAFYADLLGLKEIPKPEPLWGRGGCWFVGPGIELHLGVEAGFSPAKKAHPAFRVSALHTLREKLERAGVSTQPDRNRPDADRFYAEDPFGNRLEFLEKR